MPLLWFCLAVIIGITTTSVINFPHQILWPIISGSFFAGLLEIRYSRSHYHPLLSKPIFKIPVAFIILGFALGINQFQNALPENNPKNIHHYTDIPSVVATGIVTSDPRRSNRYTSLTVDCDQIISDGEVVAVSGKMAVSLPSGFLIQYGDRVQLAGDIKSTLPDGALPIASREGRQKVFAEMAFPDIVVIESDQGNPVLTSLYRLRDHAHNLLFDLMPFPESAVLSGILLGIDTSIPDYLWNGYRASGTVHIIVISGFNISIIAFLLYKIFRKILMRKWVLPATFIIVVLYTILVGAEQPVVRAAIMALIGLPAAQFGRRSVGIHSLTIAAAIMLFINPFQLWDISFQLSFLATLALLTMVDPIKNWIIEKFTHTGNEDTLEKPAPAIEFLVTTICASFVVFPILFKMTGTISTVSLPANFLIVPLQPLIMVLGGLAVLVGLISPWIGSLFARIAWPFLAFCNQVALRSSIHPAAALPMPDWVFWISLIASVAVLIYFSVKQIIGFSIPNYTED